MHHLLAFSGIALIILSILPIKLFNENVKKGFLFLGAAALGGDILESLPTGLLLLKIFIGAVSVFNVIMAFYVTFSKK